MNSTRIMMPTRLWLAALAACLLHAGVSTAGVLFSYDASTGQFPTDQGWSSFEVDTDGPLTDANTAGTTADNSNAAIETFTEDGLSVLHIRDTLTDGSADLPTYYYAWTPQQQNALVNYGLKFTMVFKGLRTTQSGKGNVRFGFNGTLFETLGFTNIGADRTYEILGLSAELAPLDDVLHTLVVEGEKVGDEYLFSATLDGTAVGAGQAKFNTNPAAAEIESTVYFGGSSSGGRGTDILVRSVVMETLNVPEPSTTIMGSLLAASLTLARRGRRT